MARHGKAATNKTYLDWIRAQHCIICAAARTRQVERTEAAHTGERGLSQKASDLEAIPLCGWHHRLGKDAHHVLGKNFWAHHGIVREDLVRDLQQQFYREAA